MYLETAKSFEEIITYGIDPLLVLMDVFEDEFIDCKESDSRKRILWTELRSKVLTMQNVARKVLETEMAERKKAAQDKKKLAEIERKGAADEN